MILQILMVASMVSANNSGVYSNVFEFNSLDKHQYAVVNDSVMGGRSVSRLLIEQDVAVFKGDISFKNNGGFASIRFIWPFSNKEEGQTIKLKVMGDGHVYQLRLRTDKGFDGAAYSHTFETTDGKTQTFTFDVNLFKPTYRGRILKHMPDLDLSGVKQFGIMVADKQIGDFELVLLTLALAD